jgi:Ca-activated chloride channel homolog
MSFPEDNDPFNALRQSATPRPSTAARARALAAGQSAFTATQKSATRTKGIGAAARLRSIITSLKRISIMDTRIPFGSAALALVLLPLGWQLYSTTAPAPSVLLRQEAAPAEMEVAAESIVAQPAPPPPASPAPALAQRSVTEGFASQPPSIIAAPPAAEPTGDTFTAFDEQRLKLAAEEPVSTFSVDVDTASYAYVRRMLEDGMLPEPDALRIEELLNYFPYDYPSPASAAEPFRPALSVFPTPWNPETQLLRIGIRGFEPPATDTRSNLVFLIDTSGSMNEPDKLPLLKRAFALLLDQLGADDTVSIVTYAGSAGVVLEPTDAGQKARILSALDGLAAGGGTAGAAGIELAYRLAEEARIAGGTNRVILATDGDFNVGIDTPEGLQDFIAGRRQAGIGLSVLGFGRGNLDDATMQALAQNGDGNASYISSFAEARKVLVEEVGGTLHTIARDVKIQVEFNPAQVADYRLIGYETRALNREDFSNDAVDAGDVGAGHTVTALYEITPAGAGQVDPLRYGEEAPLTGSDELAFFKLRYKLPESDVSELIEIPVTADMVHDDIGDAGVDAQFAAAVAAFGQKLRGSVYGDMSWDEIESLARAGRGMDEGGYRAEFVRLVATSAALRPDGRKTPPSELR